MGAAPSEAGALRKGLRKRFRALAREARRLLRAALGRRGIDAAAVAGHWSAKTRTTSNWWTSKLVVKEYNRRICGHPHASSIGGIRELILQRSGGDIPTALSVGCGNGSKELELLRSGAVRTITAFDLAPGRIANARRKAQEMGLADRADFRVGDAFREAGRDYGLVFWSAALHHMQDTRACVRWSRGLLRPGGLFAMAEYVGPNRFQIDDESLATVNRVRGALPDRMFVRGSGRSHARALTRRKLAQACRKDPSEAFDSASILPGVRETFPDAEIRLAGGLLYFLALSGLYSQFDMSSQEDRGLLRDILRLDGEELSRRPETSLYAAAVARA
jgi:SAM-dependent methyltransferase